MAESILKCPNEECGIILRDGGVEIIIALFPFTFSTIKDLLNGTINRAKCPSCGTVVQFDPVVYFAHLPTEESWLYIPEEINHEYPQLIEECRKKIDSLRDKFAGLGIADPITSIELLRNKAIEVIRSRYGLLFNELLLARAEGKNGEWIEHNLDRLDFPFFTFLQLILEEAFPIYFQVAYYPEDEDIDQPAEEQVLEELIKLRVYLVNNCLIRIAIDLLMADNLFTLPAVLNKRIPQCVLDKVQINALASIAESMNMQEEIPGQAQYALEAVTAWAAYKVSIPNPRMEIWAGYVVQLEKDIAAGDEKKRISLSRQRVSDDFLRNTLNYRLLWDQIVRILRNGSIDPKKYEDILGPIFSLTDRLGWSHSIFEALRKLFIIQGLDSLPQTNLLRLFEYFLKALPKEGGAEALAQMLQRVIQARRFEVAYIAFRKAITYLQAVRLDDAAYLVARYAQAFNESGYGEEADHTISEWVDQVRKTGQWKALNVPMQIDLLNEWANAKRYQGKYEVSIELYNEALNLNKIGASDDQQRILLKNLGIVYRDAGHLLEGITLIKKSLEFATPPIEKATTLHSLAVSYDLLGDVKTALEYIDQSYELLGSEKPEVFAEERALILLTLIQILKKLDQGIKALAICGELFDLTKVLKDPLLLLQVVSFAFGLLSPEERAQHHEIIELTWQLSAELFKPGIAIRTDVKASLLTRLAQIALTEKDYQRFWNLITQVEQLPQEVLLKDAWRLSAIKARAAFADEDWERAFSLLQESWRQLMMHLSQENIQAIPLSFASDRELLQEETGVVIWPAYQKGKLPGSYLALSAELQNSLLQNLALCSNEEVLLRYRDRSLTVDWIMEDIEFLAKSSGTKRPVAFLQFLLVGSEYHPLLTLYEENKIVNFVLDPPLKLKELYLARDQFRFAVETYNPASKRDPISYLEHWNHLSKILAQVLHRLVPSGAHICIIPSRELSFLPLHLCAESPDVKALIEDYTFSYIGSIFTAARLRERRLKEGRGSRWRPSCYSNFTVWQAGDYAEVKESFKSHATMLSATAQSCGCEVLSGEAHHATQGLLDEFLGKSDLLHLCCHGVVSFETGIHRLLISDGRSLPPSDQRALVNPYNNPFFLDWDSIRADHSPTIVVSCSCSSGMVSVKTGGERVGFERALFQRGTSGFIAPLWDVSVFDIHPLVSTLLQEYLTNPKMDLSQAVQIAIINGLRSGRPRHAVGALALMGDWI